MLSIEGNLFPKAVDLVTWFPIFDRDPKLKGFPYIYRFEFEFAPTIPLKLVIRLFSEPLPLIKPEVEFYFVNLGFEIELKPHRFPLALLSQKSSLISSIDLFFSIKKDDYFLRTGLMF